MDGMDGWMGWVGLLFFCFTYFSKTTLYIILIIFGPPRRRFEVSSVKKLVKKNKNKFFKKFRTKRVYFVKKSKRNSLVFRPIFVGEKIQGISLYFDTHDFFYPHLFFSCPFIFFKPLKFGKSENLRYC